MKTYSEVNEAKKDRTILLSELPDKHKKFAEKNIMKDKVYYSSSDDFVDVWSNMKKEVEGFKELFQYTDFRQVIRDK